MSRLKSALLAALFLFPTLCRAQDPSFSIDPPTAPLSCLSSGLAGNSPTFPEGQTSGALVRVELKFANASDAPVATIKFNNGGEPFARVVLDYLSAYRLPCLAPGQSLSAVQEFQFVLKHDTPGVLSSDVRFSNESNLLPDGCTVEGLDRPPPAFPMRFSQPASSSVNVVVLIRFNATGQAPDANVLFDGGERRFAETVVRHVGGLRLNCPRPLDQPVIARQTFRFIYGDSETSRLKRQLTLQQLLGSVEGLERYKVRFDSSTMDCPFSLRFEPYEPYSFNNVYADVRAHPGRREFIEWLRRVEVKIPKQVMRTAIGEPTIVAVPCALLDLT